jgi:hypothetical protein
VAWYYKNKSSTVQTINLKSGKSLYVGAGEEVALEGDDRESDEIVAKIRGSRPTGALLEKSEDKASPTPSKPDDTGGSQ